FVAGANEAEVENGSGTGAVPDAQGDRGTGVRADQRVAWVPTVPAARIAEGASGMETDMSHPQFAQAVPLRESLADVLSNQEGKAMPGLRERALRAYEATNEVTPGFNLRSCRCSMHLQRQDQEIVIPYSRQTPRVEGLFQNDRFALLYRSADGHDGELVGLDLVPLLNEQSLGFEQLANQARLPADNFFQDGNQNRQRAIADDRTLGDRRKIFVLGDGDGETVAPVHVQHDVNVGAAVADVHNAVGAGLEFIEQPVDDSHLAVAG